MAKKYKFEVEADTGDAERNLDNVKDKVQDIGDSASKGKSEISGISKLTPALSKGFKAVGTAIKAAFAATGIGVVLSLVEVFRSNQKVLDIFNTATESVKVIFRDIWDMLEPLTNALGKLFSDPVEGIKELGRMVKDYVINYFQQAWDIIKNVGGAIANLVTGDWAGLKANLKEIGTSIGDAFLGAEGATEKMIENVVEAVKEADKLVQLLNKVKIAEAELERIREKGDLRLEKLRQLRDDETKSIADRIKANEELGKALDEQILKELEIAKLKTQAAKLEYEKSGLIEEQANYIRAQAQEISILNRLEGQRSEQLMNTNSLLREQKEIQKGIKDTQQEIQALRDEQARMLKKTTLEQLQFDLESMDKTKAARQQSIDDELALTQQGTARYQELLNERAIIEETYNRDKLAKQQEVADEEKRIAQEVADAKKKEQENLAGFEKAMNATRKQWTDAETEYTLAAAEAVYGAVGQIAAENAGVQKGISIAEAIMQTYKGANVALGSSPPPWNFVMAASVVAAGIANVLKIAKTKIPGGKNDTSANVEMGAGGQRQAGTFSMVQPLSARMTDALLNSKMDIPLRAYVVNSDIQSAAELERSIKTNAMG